MLHHLLHLFTPRNSNNHRPRILHPAGLSLLIGIYLFSNASVRLLAASHTDILFGTVLGYASNISPDQVVELTNQERAGRGLKTLSHNPLLSLAAQAKASDMFTFNYWAHNNPTNGKQPWGFIREAGYTYRYAGENLARDFGDTSSMMSAWMASATHRDNIVSDRYTEIGVAVVNGTLQGVETTLVVQMFGNPASPSLGGPASKQSVAASTLGQSQTSASPTPSSQPARTPIPETEQKEVISPISIVQASEPQATTNLLPPLSISKAVSMSILLMLAVTLLVDSILIKRRRTIRVSGKNLAHLSFLGILIIIVLISSAGGIL